MNASEVYDIVVVPASPWRRIWAPLAILAANLPFFGEGPSNPGGRRFDVVDRASGAVLTSVDELFGHDVDTLGAMQNDLATMTPEDFRQLWIDS